MRLLIPLLSLVAVSAPGCIIYENDDCDGCGWDDDGWDDDGDDWCDTEDEGSSCDTDDDTEAPTFSLAFAPGQAEQGETFVGQLRADGAFDLNAVTALRFTGGVDVLWFEARDQELRVLVDVPFSSELGPIDLVVSREGAPSALVEGALVIGEQGSGSSSNECE